MHKILYVLDSLQTGGTEKSVLEITSRLNTVKPVVCNIYNNVFLKREFEKKGVKVISLNIQGDYNFFKAYKLLKKVLTEEKPDLVVASLLRSELISRVVCWQLNIPNIGTFVNDTYSKYELASISKIMLLKIRFFWMLNAVTAKLCTGFISNSESIKESNSKALFINPKKVKVIYRGRRGDLFKYSKQTWDNGKIRFLAVGRVIYRKGFSDICLAFKEFIQDYPESTLTIAGEGGYLTELQKIIGENGLSGNVNLVGNSNDIPGLMKEHHIFLFPSHYEGFSGVLIEAMFSGIPIIASAISMNMEAVENNVTALLFEPKNTSDIVRQMNWAVKNQDEVLDMGLRARKVAEDRFSIDNIVSQHESYYKFVLDKIK